MESNFWIVSFWIALSVFISGIISVAIYTYEGRNSWSEKEKKFTKRNIRTTVSLLFFIVFTSSFFLFLPIYWEYFVSEENGVLRFVKSIFLSVHNTIRLFIVDGEYDIIKDFLADKDGITQLLFSMLSALIYVFAPALTFSFVMTFFYRLINGNRMATALRRDMYVFSELNEKSLTFAEDIRKEHSKASIVFADVYEDSEEESISEKIERARSLRAICLKNDITDIRFGYQLSKRKLYLILIGADEDENMQQSLKLIEKYKHYPRTALYLISYRDEAEAVFDGVGYDLESEESGKKGSKNHGGINKHLAQSKEYLIEFHRINPARDLIDNLLYNSGTKLLEGMNENRENKEPVKTGVIILGLGEYGSRLLRALSWYLQMDNYRAEINVFDSDKNAEKRMKSLCPCLLCENLNRKEIEGEAYYDIKIHPDTDVFSDDFLKAVEKLKNTTYVFISMGNGETNIKAAMSLRVQFERMGIHPIIQAVSYSDEMNGIWEKHLKYKGNSYDIDFVGTLEDQYKESVIFRSELQKRAFALHMSYYDESSGESAKSYALKFWNSEYNYHSSIASIIHMEAKKYCNIPGFTETVVNGKTIEIKDLDPGSMSDADKKTLQILEHKRWNSYVRSDGYIFGETRNDLGKIHHDLVPYDNLENKERGKDLRTEFSIQQAIKKYGYLYDAIDA